MGEAIGRRVVGVVGGGPLCLLLGEEIRRKALPFDLVALDPDPACPARPVLRRQIVGDLRDTDAILKLAAGCDVVTFEAEPAHGAALEELERRGGNVHPSPATLRLLHDRAAQKAFLRSKGLPVAEGAEAGAKGLTVVAARGLTGEVRLYAAAETRRQDSALVMTILPAGVDPAAGRAAEEAARRAVEALGAVGAFAIDLVVDGSGAVRVREIAPRLHSSGHSTIEACRTSQFEQHLRAVAGLPLGDPALLYSAVLVKIHGLADARGPFVLAGLDAVRSIPGAFVHLYGEKETAPGRPLGHVTLIDVNDSGYRDALVHRAEHVRRMISQKEAKR